MVRAGEKGSQYAVIKRKDGSTQIIDKNTGRIVSGTSSTGKKQVFITTSKGGGGGRPTTSSDIARAREQQRLRELEVQTAKAREIARLQSKVTRQQTAIAKARKQRELQIRRQLRDVIDRREARKQERTNIFTSALTTKTPSGRVANASLVSASIQKQINKINTKPFSTEYKRELQQLKRAYGVNKNIKTIVVAGTTQTYTTAREKKFLQSLDKVLKRNDNFQKKYNGALSKLGLKISATDSWYVKALKGAGELGVGLVSIGGFLSMLVDNAVIYGKALFSKDNFIRTLGKSGLKQAGRDTPKAVVSGFDPTKPENWAGIIFTIAGVRIAKTGMRKINLFGKSYVPSVANAGKILAELTQRQKVIRVIKSQLKKGIKNGENVAFNKRRLAKLERLDKSITKSKKTIKKIQKDPKTLKLNDYNPLIETKKLIKEIGKEKEVFHSTSARPKDLFGNKYSKLKTNKEILRAVTKASGRVRREIGFKGDIQKVILDFIKRKKGVIGGAKAQNVFVRKYLTRKTGDFDVLIKSPKLAMEELVKILKKKFPNDKFSISRLKVKFPDTKPFYVYRLKVNGKLLVDFDPYSTQLKGVPIKYKTTPSGYRVLDSKILALKKLEAVGNIKKIARFTKDSKDLRRLTGKIFSNNKFIQSLKSPKNFFTITRQPKGMGASRIRYGETQLFFDFEVPTSYAYNNLIKKAVPKSIISILQKLDLTKFNKAIGFRTGFIKQLNSIKYIKSNSRLTILKLKARVSDFPPKLRARIKKASRGELTSKQQNLLRSDINTYINKNPQKLSIGSRTGSRAVGERELVTPETTTLRKVRKQYSIDPTTKLYMDVITTSLRSATNKSLISRFKSYVSKLKKSLKPSELKAELLRRTRKGDLAKWRRFRKQLKRADKLTSAEYLDFLEFNKRLFSNIKAKAKPVGVSKKKTKTRRPKRTIVKRVTTKEASIQSLGTLKKPKARKTTTKKVRRTSTSRGTSKRTATARKTAKTRVARRKAVTKRRVVLTGRTKKRSVARPRTRPVTRTRLTPRPRTRVTPRTRLTPRTPTRPRTPVRKKPRIPVIPAVLKKKATTKKAKKDLEEWIKKQPKKYRPSLASVLYDITGYKIPKRITGFETRPIIIKRNKTRKKTIPSKKGRKKRK